MSTSPAPYCAADAVRRAGPRPQRPSMTMSVRLSRPPGPADGENSPWSRPVTWSGFLSGGHEQWAAVGEVLAGPQGSKPGRRGEPGSLVGPQVSRPGRMGERSALAGPQVSRPGRGVRGQPWRARSLDRCVIGVLSAENPDNATVEPVPRSRRLRSTVRACRPSLSLPRPRSHQDEASQVDVLKPFSPPTPVTPRAATRDRTDLAPTPGIRAAVKDAAPVRHHGLVWYDATSGTRAGLPPAAELHSACVWPLLSHPAAEVRGTRSGSHRGRPRRPASRSPAAATAADGLGGAG